MSNFGKGVKLLWGATKVAGKGVGSAVNGVRKAVANNEEAIAAGAKATVGALGKVAKVTGKVVASGAGSASEYLHSKAALSDNKVLKATGHVVGYTASAVKLVGTGTAKVGELTGKAAPAVGGAVGGSLVGAVEAVSGAVDTLVIQEADLERLRLQLRQHGDRVRERSERRLAAIEVARRGRRKAELLDLLVVGGITLSTAVGRPDAVPELVEQAFRRAYPNLAESETFAEVVSRMSPDQLVGFANGVKGKMFEIELVNHLNDGNLPAGLHAELAGSATQPGWDIRVLDSDGRVVEVLQAKATESVAYVNDALTRYPDIDVATTSEVHAQLVAVGMADGVRNGGIAEAALEAKFEAAAQSVGGSFDASDLMPSSVGLAVIALSAFVDRSQTLEQRGSTFGNRGARAVLASGAGKLAMVATQTWWLGLVAGVGSSWLAAKGRGKRESYELLKNMVSTLRRSEDAQRTAALIEARQRHYQRLQG